MKSNLISIFFHYFCFWYHIQQGFAQPEVTTIYSMFSVESFLVLALMFGSVVNFGVKFLSAVSGRHPALIFFA